MSVFTHKAAGSVLTPREARRAGRELVLEAVFRPLSSVLVRPLARMRVAPTIVVLLNGVAGVSAAVAIGADEPVLGALVLQLKTLLDNTDGQLARATGRVTLVGRYLDTVSDLCVNVAVFLALAYLTGRPLLAAAALLALAVVLAVDFNVTELARKVYGLAAQPPRASGGRVERLLGAVYTAVFAPQDRIIRAISEHRFEAAVGANLAPDLTSEARRAYFDPFTLAFLANLGLTTQLAVLGVCLVLGAPGLYLWLVIASFLVLVPLQVRRERHARLATLS